MKYKVGPKKKQDINSTVYTGIGILRCNPSTINPISAISPMVRNTTKPKALGYASFKLFFSLLKNPMSLSKVTLEALVTIYGTTSVVIQNKTPDRTGICSDNNIAIDHPTVIPSQNIRFQKLSLFIRDLMKFISRLIHILKLKSNLTILPKFVLLSKRIRLFSAIIIAAFSIQNSFGADLARLIDSAEQENKIPKGLLAAIAYVESGNKPYALNISGKSVIAGSKEEAADIARLYKNNGITNIDLGAAQINLYWHGKHFTSIEEMLEPKHNIEYAAKFLKGLYDQYGSWNKAVRYYHSAKPQQHIKYSRKILVTWLKG